MARTWSVVVVGVGSIGERHLRCFQTTGRARLAICEVQPELRERVGAAYGVEERYGGVEEMLGVDGKGDKSDSPLRGASDSSPLPDAAVIAVPAHLHVPLARRLARAGVHLLIEKPLSTGMEGVEALATSVRERGVTAAVAYVYRANPVVEALRRAVRSGRFGPPLEVVVHCGQHFPTYRPAYREIYYKDRATGGGAVQDALTHLVNAVEWIVGPVTRLAADAAHLAIEGVEVEDTVHVLARHGPVMASYSLNQHQAPNEVSITVVCRGGTCRAELHRGRWRRMSEPGGAWEDEDLGPIERDAPFTRQAHAFLDALEGARPPLCTLDEGAQTLRANLAVLASAENGTWQTVRS